MLGGSAAVMRPETLIVVCQSVELQLRTTGELKSYKI